MSEKVVFMPPVIEDFRHRSDGDAEVRVDITFAVARSVGLMDLIVVLNL